MENKQLNAVYNGNKTIANAGFTMQSRFVVPVLARMVNEKLLLQSGMDVIQAILSFKHTEENPYPTRETIALYLGKSVDYVKKGLKSIKDTGIVISEKSGRKSTYNFNPFFVLLEKFIVEFKQNKNHKVKISELLKVKVKKKEEKDFSWSEEYKEVEKEIEKVEVVEEVTEPIKEVLPEEIKKVAEVYNVDAEGITAIEKAFIAYSSKLSVEVFIEKIVASSDKKGFVNYFNKCITTAYVNNEQPKKASIQQAKTVKPVRQEKIPTWFGKTEENSATESIESLLKQKARYEEMMKSDLMKSNVSLINSLQVVNEKLEAYYKVEEQNNKEEEGVL